MPPNKQRPQFNNRTEPTSDNVLNVIHDLYHRGNSKLRWTDMPIITAFNLSHGST
jgi:tRNA uridine 5-carbamoylmethylation protein Kti12